MSEFTLGDVDDTSSNKTTENFDQEAANIAAEVSKSIEITDDDRKKVKRKKKTVSKKNNAVDEEFEDVLDMTAELSEFIKTKIDLSNDAEDIGKFPTGVDVLDAIAGGGFGVGTFTMIVGNPGTFKSSLLAQTIAAGQAKYAGKMLATYHDSETAMTQSRLAQMGVVNPAIVPYDNVSVESIFQTVEAISAFKQLHNIEDVPTVVAWDSIANTDTKGGIESEDVDINKTIGRKAKILSQLFPRFLPKMRKNNISIIAVNQLREKLQMGQFSAPADLQHMGNKEVPGGQAVKFNAFHMLYLRNGGDLKFDQYGFNGVKIKAHFVKNKFFRPEVPVTLLVDFNKGVSNFWTNYNFLVDNKKIKAGAWNTLMGYDEKKFRTKDALEIYNSDKKFKLSFDKHVKETIQSTLIDPNMASN